MSEWVAMSRFSVAQAPNTSAGGDCMVSIIIPVLNEAEQIVDCLQPLQRFRYSGKAELIVVDGGSEDDTEVLAEPLCDAVISTVPGRAQQMNVGAGTSRGEWLLFLHADTELPEGGQWLAGFSQPGQSAEWGFFSIRLSGSEWWARVISRGINWRSRLTSIATGDQCIFVSQRLFKSVGGYPNIPLMEDIALSKALKKLKHKPANPGLVVQTSSRRWRYHGVVRTVLFMWLLRFLYASGVSPKLLHRLYYGKWLYKK